MKLLSKMIIHPSDLDEDFSNVLRVLLLVLLMVLLVVLPLVLVLVLVLLSKL